MRVGSHGNVIATSLPVCSTSMPAGLGLGQDRDQAEQMKLKGRCFDRVTEPADVLVSFADLSQVKGINHIHAQNVLLQLLNSS